MRKRFVLKNKTRFFTTLSFPLVVTAILLFSQPVMGYNNEQYEVINIEEGDTLWDIAARYNSHDDIRKYIYDIKTLNGLKGSFIAAGETLKIPK